jgi:hypothetical protein
MFDGKNLLKKYWNKLRHAKHMDYTEKTDIYEEAPAMSLHRAGMKFA